MQRIKLYHQTILEWKDAQMEAIDKSFPNAFETLVETILFIMIAIGALVILSL